MIQPIRFLVDSPADGAWNMAVDEALWRVAAQTRVPVLRLYRWEPATVSLGYFQRCGQRRCHRASLELPWIRRASGGGAIVHDRELTYSLAWPLTARTGRISPQLYQLVHHALCDVLRDEGIELCILDRGCEHESEAPPFLCFQRRSPGDGMLRQFKVLGSAQRRNRGVLLQHGSLLWERSRWAPELPGVADLVEAPIGSTAESIGRRWMLRIALRLETRLVGSVLSESERELADKMRDTRYSCPVWNEKR